MKKLPVFKMFPALLLIVILIITGCGGGGGGPEAPVGPPGTIVISGASPANVTTFYGENYWCWVGAWSDPVHGTQAQANALHLNVLRAGGYNNDAQTPEAFSHTQVDEYVTYCRNIGAEPILQVSLLKNINGQPATAQDAADWVTYCNKTKSYNIKYWEIGNEPDLYQDQGDKTSYSVTDFCNDFKNYSTAMKAVDNTIKILGPEYSWKYPPQTGSNDWLTPFLDNCQGYFDIVAIHRYPFRADQCTMINAFGDGANFRTFIRNIRNLMDNKGLSNIQLAITEANITWQGDPALNNLPASPHTFFAGIWLADSLGTALEEKLWTIAYWSICESWDTGFIDFNTKKPKPVYYVLQMYATHFGAKMIKPTSVPSGFSVYASRDLADSSTILIVINKNNTKNHETIKFTDFATSSVDREYDFTEYSITCLAIPDNGGPMQIWSYTKQLADQGSPPVQIQ